MKRCKTVKLFYDQYPYKITIRNALSHIFRDKNFSYAKSELDALQLQLDNGQPLQRRLYSKIANIQNNTFFEAQNLYIEFVKQKDFKLRIENPNMQVYSHDYDWLEHLIQRFDVLAFWEPTSKLEKNIILVDTAPEYQYKVTLDVSVDPALADWITNNPDKAKAGATCLKTIRNNGYARGFYFYARDDKILQLLNLFIGKVQRIDKLVYIAKTDK